MKILKKGLLEKDGIHFECEDCRAEILLEGREDITTHPDTYITTMGAEVETVYTVQCPVCQGVTFLGYVDADSQSDYSCLRKREDWEKKFKIVYNKDDYKKFWEPIKDVLGGKEKTCWETGEYNDECCCEMCEHRDECSGHEEK